MSSEQTPQGDQHYTNRLIHETSPYLLQHKHNPVEWFPWSEEAFAIAKKQNKPLMLSVGYSSCHWCHIMEAESFENPDTAALMNELFVNIKVDREERPDIDAIYMAATQALTGSGGWPMTVFLTPEGVPFFAGTYFPPTDRHGMPSFTRVLRSVAEAFDERRGEVERAGQQLLDHLRRASLARPDDGLLSDELLAQAAARLAEQFDAQHGGFGGAPKFPQPMTLQFLLRWHVRSGDQQALHMVEQTIQAMAGGGIYDQLAGGFHRYSVDAHWLVPHFEKMLYDNAQLALLYLEAWQVTGTPLYKRVAEETLDYVAREMTHELGGFFSTEDADSQPYEVLGASQGHKEEGAFYVWTPAEAREVLGADAGLFCQLYDVTVRGNFEGKSILNLPRSAAEVARVTGVTPERLEQVRDRGRDLLRAARASRPRPERDEKVLTAWNGLMLRAFADAARVLGRADYLVVAERNAAFLLEAMLPEGRLLRSWKDVPAADGGRGVAKIPAYLEDYSMLTDGLLALYGATFTPRWLQAASDLAEQMVARFWDEELGGFYDTAADHEALITRPRDLSDNAMPAGNSVACEALLRLARLRDLPAYDEQARAVLASLAEPMAAYPSAFGRLLCAADWAVGPVRELALVGPLGGDETRALLAVANSAFRPRLVVALRDAEADAAIEALVPLLRERPMIDGQATAYLCEQYACQLPVTEPAALAAQLA